MSSPARLAAIAVILCLSAGFVGCDPRWGEAKRVQQRVAADWKPATIGPASDDRAAPHAAKRTLLVRLRPSRRYLAQTVDAPKRIADLLADANGVLEPTLALTLEMNRVEPWSSDADEHLEPALAALQVDDRGQDVDVVVGMIAALPRQTDSLHELGMASLLGKHLVVRAASRLGEYNAIDKSFYELSSDERARLVHVHQRHRALAVFLHELGHTLGALHETDARSLMHPSYSEKMTGFSGGSITLMRIALSEGDRAAVARAQLDVLRESSSGDWVAADRNEAMTRLQAMFAPRPEAGVRPALAAAKAPEAPAELRGDDRERFIHASDLFRSGAARLAYEIARPLFAAYPSVYAVQDLRCQLATVRWLDLGELKAECAPVARLSTHADAGDDAAR
jgi:hypothetical protein